jgi:hypothetical protein
MYRRSMNPTLTTTSDLPVFFSLKKFFHKLKCGGILR